MGILFKDDKQNLLKLRTIGYKVFKEKLPSITSILEEPSLYFLKNYFLMFRWNSYFTPQLKGKVYGINKNDY